MSDDVKTHNCRYFNGVQNERCKAGYRYKDIADVATHGDLGYLRRLPCVGNDPSIPPMLGFVEAPVSVCDCPGLSRFTDDEDKANQAELDAYIAAFLPKMTKARAAIIQHVGNRKRKAVADSLPCPVCGSGTLHYTYAGNYNRHVHAKCTTSDCIQWGE